jgi:hypothetical protein
MFDNGGMAGKLAGERAAWFRDSEANVLVIGQPIR